MQIIVNPAWIRFCPITPFFISLQTAVWGFFSSGFPLPHSNFLLSVALSWVPRDSFISPLILFQFYLVSYLFHYYALKCRHLPTIFILSVAKTERVPVQFCSSILSFFVEILPVFVGEILAPVLVFCSFLCSKILSPQTEFVYFLLQKFWGGLPKICSVLWWNFN